MPPTYSGPSAYSTYVPSADATGGLIVGFSRNPAKFAHNQYMQFIEVPTMVGYYTTYRSTQAARITQSDLSQFVFPDGMPAPTGFDNVDKFTRNLYTTTRYAFPFAIGDLAREQSDLDLLPMYQADAAQQAMTARSLLAYSALANGDYASVGNTDTATNLGGGFWDAGSETAPYIKKTLNEVRVAILKKTLGVVTSDDLILVVNPDTAKNMAKSAEIHSYLARSVFAYPTLGQTDKKMFDNYGLLPVLYGFKIVVDDTVLITSKEGASSDTFTFTVADNEAYVVSRPGGLSAPKGGRAFSSLTCFWHKDEMTVYTKHDPDDLLTKGRIVMNYQIQLTSPKSAYKIQGLFS